MQLSVFQRLPDLLESLLRHGTSRPQPADNIAGCKLGRRGHHQLRGWRQWFSLVWLVGFLWGPGHRSCSGIGDGAADLVGGPRMAVWAAPLLSRSQDTAALVCRVLGPQLWHWVGWGVRLAALVSGRWGASAQLCSGHWVGDIAVGLLLCCERCCVVLQATATLVLWQQEGRRQGRGEWLPPQSHTTQSLTLPESLPPLPRSVQ